MTTQEFLNFKEISSTIPFEDVLNWLNIPFQKKKDELKGDGFIISIKKNLFFTPGNDNIKGSVINFVSHHKQIDLREAAVLLKQEFLSKEKESKPKRDIPDLTLVWDPYIQERGITPEVANEYCVGFVRQRSIMAGRIAFKVHDHSGNHIGYIGFKKEDSSWFFPKGFQRPLFGSCRLKDTRSVIVTTDPFDALKIASQGFKQVVSLLAKSMTREQEKELKRFKYILLFHPEPENIVNRLYSTSFIKAPVLSNPLKDMSEQMLHDLIKKP